jgi:hypothetical protein
MFLVHGAGPPRQDMQADGHGHVGLLGGLRLGPAVEDREHTLRGQALRGRTGCPLMIEIRLNAFIVMASQLTAEN